MSTSSIRSGVRTLANRTGDVAFRGMAGRHRSIVNRGPRSRPCFALTFDDGPCWGGTEQVIDALADVGAPATFFCVGYNAERHASMVQRLDRAGHVVGNHSYCHRRRQSLSPRDADHISRSEAALVDVLGKVPHLYRPPSGWLVPWERRRLTGRGYTIIGWDVDPRDWADRSPQSIAASVVEQVRPGSIVALHDGFAMADACDRAATAAAVRLIVPMLESRGLRPCSVAALLGVEPYRQESSDSAN
jgi:peptidoglycan-N-acetylglucosamine deacetylase